jgi:hypothetical protein
LPKKLRLDLRGLRIVKEADLECAAYYHLRRFIGEDPRWRVLARKHVPVTGHYVDLLIFKRRRPAIAIELKWGKKEIGTKDTKSLKRARRDLKVNRVYWFSAVASAPTDRIASIGTEKYRFYQRLITPRLLDEELERWKEDRAYFRAKMGIGRG